tara:strand:- start:74 stop:415 length:342 start_codon:yes stop_codon:yes gene_type:complete
MKKFLKTKSFTGFEIFIAFLVPTIVYYIFAVKQPNYDSDGYLRNNKQVINCKRLADQAVKNEVKAGRIFSKEGQEKQYKVEMGFCLENLPYFLEQWNTTMEKYMESRGLKYKK